MAMAIPIMMAVGTAVSVVSAIQQGRAAKAAANFNTQVARQNQEIANQDAQIAREQAALQANQADREGRLRLGKIRAAHGASGGAFEGSVLDVLGDVAAQNELEKQDVIYQGELQARSALNRGAGFANEAALETARGKSAQRAGYLSAGKALLSGGTETYKAFKRV